MTDRFLVFSVAVASILAACGPADGGKEPQTPPAPTATTEPPPSPAPTTTETPPSPTGTGAATPPPPTPGPMKPVMASAMAADLKEIGIDPKNLPASLNKLDPEKLRKVMKTFTKALGTQCNGCHDPNDFRAPTRNKKIASRMWTDFTKALTMQDGSLLYCDSCHQGKMEFLDRHDKKALSAWMDDNFVSKMKKVDKKDHSCATCHGDPIEGQIFTTLWKIPPSK